MSTAAIHSESERGGFGEIAPPTAARAPATLGMLGAFGPGGTAAPVALDEARRVCRELATGHYENFSVLTRLVPERLRDDFGAVYAFCRWSDDLADETGAGAGARRQSERLLEWWRGELDRCLAFAARRDIASAPLDDDDRPRHPVFVALASTLRRHDLPAAPFHHLLDAFAQDQRVTRYQTWDELLAYCRGSAEPVGRIVLGLGGVSLDDPANAERVAMSDATCTALQLTNFWQDVRRDLVERDRVYMPQAETGLNDAALRSMIERPEDSESRVRFIRALRPLVERTWSLFAQGRPLPGTLPGELRPVVWLFGAGGERVLRKVDRAGCTTLWRRPRLSGSEKAMLLLRAGMMRTITR